MEVYYSWASDRLIWRQMLLNIGLTKLHSGCVTIKCLLKERLILEDLVKKNYPSLSSHPVRLKHFAHLWEKVGSPYLKRVLTTVPTATTNASTNGSSNNNEHLLRNCHVLGSSLDPGNLKLNKAWNPPMRSCVVICRKRRILTQMPTWESFSQSFSYKERLLGSTNYQGWKEPQRGFTWEARELTD